MTFDRKIARTLLEICRYTYAQSFTEDPEENTDKQDALKWLIGYGELDNELNIHIINGSDTSTASVTYHPNMNIVSYMGTKTEFDNLKNAERSIEDWAENFKACLVDFKMTNKQLGLADNNNEIQLGGCVHKGFLEEFCAVQAGILEKLNKEDRKNFPLYITGYSQGGAEAAIATRAFLKGKFKIAATYTFAAPKPGNQEFARTIPEDIPVHRIEFGNDIVPHVPSTWITNEAMSWSYGMLDSVAPHIAGFLKSTIAYSGFVGVGKLCYGNNTTRNLRVDISAKEEEELFIKRLKDLITNPGDWAGHHHLAGTTTDIKQGKKGNYTDLITYFSMW